MSFRPPFESITVGEAAAELAGPEPPYLLDVREHAELVDHRVAGAAWLPMSRFTLGVGRLPRDRRILVICAHGNRSGVVADFLTRSGFAEVANIEGGTEAWRRAGHATIGGPLGDDELPLA